MYVYLDYLDYRETLGHSNFSVADKLRRLTVDLFAFPDARFAFAYPALAKCMDTAIVLGEASRLWRAGRLWPTLSPSYRGDFDAYTQARETALREAFGDSAERTVELAGYLLPHWSALLRIVDSYDAPVPVRARIGSADEGFRVEVKGVVDSGRLQADLFENTSMLGRDIESSVQRLWDASQDPGQLFQRAKIVDDFVRAGFTRESLRWLSHYLDRAFGAANAHAAGASLTDTQMRRRDIVRHLLRSLTVDGEMPVASALLRLPIDTIVDISVGATWRRVLRLVEHLEHKVVEVAARGGARDAARTATERTTAAAISLLMIPVGALIPGLGGALSVGSAAGWAKLPSRVADSLRTFQNQAAPHLDAFVNEVRLELEMNRGYLLPSRAGFRWQRHGVQVVDQGQLLNPLDLSE